MKCLWLGGWASHMACWKEKIERDMPGMEHTCLDTHSLIDEDGQGILLERGGGRSLPENLLFKTDVGIAWSMGSLYLLHWLAKTKPKPESLPRWVCCNPILHFCHPEYGWSPRVLARMRRLLEQSPRQVLHDFWKLMSKGEEAEALREPWLLQGRSYSVASLRKGLDFLENVTVEAESLQSYREKLIFLAATNDAVAKVSKSIQVNGLSTQRKVFSN